MKIYNKKYNLDANINKTIILISDLHYANKKDIRRLIDVLKNIENQHPDFICIPGDIVDSCTIKDKELLTEWFKSLSKIATVIISIGNHELYTDRRHSSYETKNEFIMEIGKIDNVHLLDNQTIIIDNINFIGITFPLKYHNHVKIDKTLEKLKPSTKTYNVLLCHSPISICNKDILSDKNIDLALCGHMHGGIVLPILRPIFKNSGLISPNKTLFPKIAYGLIKIDGANIIITSGIKVFPNNCITKLFRPEIVSINLNFSKNTSR